MKILNDKLKEIGKLKRDKEVPPNHLGIINHHMVKIGSDVFTLTFPLNEITLNFLEETSRFPNCVYTTKIEKRQFYLYYDGWEKWFFLPTTITDKKILTDENKRFGWTLKLEPTEIKDEPHTFDNFVLGHPTDDSYINKIYVRDDIFTYKGVEMRRTLQFHQKYIATAVARSSFWNENRPIDIYKGNNGLYYAMNLIGTFFEVPLIKVTQEHNDLATFFAKESGFLQYEVFTDTQGLVGYVVNTTFYGTRDAFPAIPFDLT